MQKLSSSEVPNPQHSVNIQKNHSQSVSKTQRQPMPLHELWLELSRYRDLKQLPLNPISQQKDQLWRDSPCTVRCPNRNISIDRIQRFRMGSIYYRDNINQQKKKPQLLLKNFRRQVQEASHSKHKYTRKSLQGSAEKPKISINLGKTMPLIDNKFYQVPKKIELKYDRNGTRSSFNGDYDVKQIINQFRQTKPNFTSSRRLDLALPLNFNPGPGKYFSQVQNLIANQNQKNKITFSKNHSQNTLEKQFL